MKASIKQDTTDRTIGLEVSGVADLEVTRSWQKRPRFIRPDGAQIKVTNDVCQSINVWGPLVLKSGGTSDNVRDNREWSLTRYSGDFGTHIDNAPEWVRVLWTEAVNGVTSWHTPDMADPAEVQPLN